MLWQTIIILFLVNDPELRELHTFLLSNKCRLCLLAQEKEGILQLYTSATPNASFQIVVRVFQWNTHQKASETEAEKN